MSHRLSRRRFLHTTLAAAAGAAALPHFVRAAAPTSAATLPVAVIGCGGRGGDNLRGVAADANIVALCDVDARNLSAAAQRHPGAKTYRDFRRMFDDIAQDFAAVVVSTPDHTHALAGVLAMKLGKHLYCEKPLTHSVHEARVMADLAREKKLCTQMGTQIHAGANYRRAVEIVQAGSLGPVKEVHVWQPSVYSPGGRPQDTPPVPPHLDWDLWLGPAPYRPYHPAYVPANWRGWWDFGGGGVGDFFCHYADLAFWALDLRHPTRVAAEGPPVHPESCPRWLIARYAFPARGALPPVALTWYGGGRQPPLLKEAGLPAWGAGVLFVGEKGMLMADYGRHKLFPEDKFAGFTPPTQTIPPSIGHHKEWVVGCQTGKPTTCSFDYAGPLAEAALLANVAYRCGEPLDWDAKALKATNTTRAAPYIRREYRKGWTL